MPANTNPIFPVAPFVGFSDLSAVTAVATRAPTADATLVAATTQYKLLAAPSTNGIRIDAIEVQACSTAIGAATVSQLVQVWLSNATTAYLIDEINTSAVTPSTTVASFTGTKSYSNLVVPATYKLWVSTTITTTAATTALSVIAYGGAY